MITDFFGSTGVSTTEGFSCRLVMTDAGFDDGIVVGTVGWEGIDCIMLEFGIAGLLL